MVVLPIPPDTEFFAGLTSYLGIAGIDSRRKDGVLFGASAIKFRDITDGISQTLLVGERPASVGNDLGWWYAGVGNGEGALDHTLGVKDNVANPFLTCETSFYTFKTKDSLNLNAMLYIFGAFTVEVQILRAVTLL